LIPNLITPTSLIHINFSRPELKSIQAPIEILYPHGITHNITFRIQNNPSAIQKPRTPVPCDSPPGGYSTLPSGSSQTQEQHCPTSNSNRLPPNPIFKRNFNISISIIQLIITQTALQITKIERNSVAPPGMNSSPPGGSCQNKNNTPV